MEIQTKMGFGFVRCMTTPSEKDRHAQTPRLRAMSSGGCAFKAAWAALKARNRRYKPPKTLSVANDHQ